MMVFLCSLPLSVSIILPVLDYALMKEKILVFLFLLEKK